MTPFPRDYEIDAAMAPKEAPDSEFPEPRLRGRRLPCPHCGAENYFGIGETPGLLRSEDFILEGLAFCCGKPVLVICGAKVSVGAM